MRARRRGRPDSAHSAFLLSAVIAIPLGIWMASYRLVNGVVEPLMDFSRYLPVPALVPLTVIWLGIGETSKIALLWLGTFFQLVLLIADDARRVPREYVEVGMTVGAKPRAVLRHIILPAMLPTGRRDERRLLWDLYKPSANGFLYGCFPGSTSFLPLPARSWRGCVPPGLPSGC